MAYFYWFMAVGFAILVAAIIETVVTRNDD